MADRKKYTGMSIRERDGERKYLNKAERASFLISAQEEKPEYRMYCEVLHYTGGRLSEVLEVTPDSICFSEKTITFRTLKKRKLDKNGKEKLPEFRSVPVPDDLLDRLDLTFSLRKKTREGKEINVRLWPVHRMTISRLIGRVMERANITGKKALSKGLRHGFAIAMLTSENAPPLHIIRDLLGHSDTEITEIYTEAIGEEKRKLVMQAWD